MFSRRVWILRKSDARYRHNFQLVDWRKLFSGHNKHCFVSIHMAWNSIHREVATKRSLDSPSINPCIGWTARTQPVRDVTFLERCLFRNVFRTLIVRFEFWFAGCGFCVAEIFAFRPLVIWLHVFTWIAVFCPGHRGILQTPDYFSWKAMSFFSYLGAWRYFRLVFSDRSNFRGCLRRRQFLLQVLHW